LSLSEFFLHASKGILKSLAVKALLTQLIISMFIEFFLIEKKLVLKIIMAQESNSAVEES